MRPPGIARAASRQEGVVALEAVFLMPAVLFGAMLLFEMVRMALVVVIGTLALDTALGSLRMPGNPAFNDTASVQQAIKTAMLAASYSYLSEDDFGVQVASYAGLGEFGLGIGGQGSATKIPVVVVNVKLTQDWITPLPTLVGLERQFTYTYHQVLGNLYGTTRNPP